MEIQEAEQGGGHDNNVFFPFSASLSLGVRRGGSLDQGRIREYLHLFAQE